jgi:PST family polysaccharide transporter
MVAFPLFTFRFLGTVTTATAAMVLFLKGYLYILGPLDLGRLGAAFQSLSSVLFGGFLFLLIIIRGRVFREEELALFPLGSKLIHLIPRKDRS